MIQRPPELFVSERPVRSDYARERSYARRRFVTVIVLALVAGGTAYALWGRGARNPADIPTIRAEGTYKQKPADPGGIDIPHQDVQVYDQLEPKNANPPPQVEHLLPPPEVPKDVPRAEPPAPAASAPVAAAASPADLVPAVAAKPVQTTVAPAPVTAPVSRPTASAPQAPPATIEQIIEKTKASPSSATPVPGGVAVQLASVPDQAKAQAMMEELQKKYAPQLGSAILQLVRADLGSRGIYYRIQSQGLAEADASRLCSSLKQMNAGCILVRK